MSHSLLPASPALRVVLEGPVVILHEDLQAVTSAPVAGVELVSSVQASVWSEGLWPGFIRARAHKPLQLYLEPGGKLTVRPHNRPGVLYLAPRVALSKGSAGLS
jgi:hypothetical protein